MERPYLGARISLLVTIAMLHVKGEASFLSMNRIIPVLPLLVCIRRVRLRCVVRVGENCTG